MLTGHEFRDAKRKGLCEVHCSSLVWQDETSPAPLFSQASSESITIYVQVTAVSHGLNKCKLDDSVLRQKMNTSNVGLYLKRLSSPAPVGCAPYSQLSQFSRKRKQAQTPSSSHFCPPYPLREDLSQYSLLSANVQGGAQFISCSETVAPCLPDPSGDHPTCAVLHNPLLPHNASSHQSSEFPGPSWSL